MDEIHRKLLVLFHQYFCEYTKYVKRPSMTTARNIRSILIQSQALSKQMRVELVNTYKFRNRDRGPNYKLSGTALERKLNKGKTDT